MSTWADKIWLLQIVEQRLSRIQNPSAENIHFSSSSLESTDVKAALEELAERISNLQNN